MLKLCKHLNYLLVTMTAGGSDGKESTSSAGYLGSIPGLGRFPGERSGNPLHCFCLGNPTDREACGLQSTGLQRIRHDLGTKQYHPKRILFYPLLSSPLYKNNSCFLLKYHPLGEVKSHVTLAINAFFFN